MKTQRIFVSLVVAASLILGNVSTALALPPIPSSFYGVVTVDGVNAPAGSTVSAWIDGVMYAQTAVGEFGGDTIYSLDIPGDDSDTPGETEGGTPGDTILFHINDLVADQSGTWTSGTNIELNLTATSPASVSTGDVIIAGFQSWNNVTGQSDAEYVSLFNTTDQTISLANMEFYSRVDNDSDGVVDVDWQLSADLTGKSIAPYSFFLIAESGVAAPGGIHDIEVDWDLATGEGGFEERAIGYDLLIDGVHMDYVLYGRHDGSSPAGEIPEGDIPFDGSSWPRAEVIRNTLETQSYQEGLARRVSADDLYAGYDVPGYYTDEDTLGDGYPNGVWASPHSNSFGNYEARNSLSPAVLPPVPPVCYVLTLGHTGQGSTPVASPASSTGCSANEYVEGEAITLSGAVPDAGWQIDSWYGTDGGNTFNMPANAHSAGVNYAELPPTTMTCESFDAYTPGSTIGSYAEWFDGGTGPVVTSGLGVANSIGLADATSIFTWTANPFDWTAPDFVGVNLQADFQTDASGHFDDDRVGWMITDSSNGSDNIFGVQLDPGGSGYNIEAYWDGDTFGDNGGRTSIADLPALTSNSWYRLRAEITKLTDTSAMIFATLTALDGSGNPGAVVASGSIADTALLPDTAGEEIPNPGYFTGPIWPAYKNYTTVGASADNTCFEIVTGTPPPQYDLTVNIVGNGSVALDPPGSPTGTYYEGTSVQLTANADIGWVFSGWSDDLSGSTNPETITMDADKTVTATFTETPAQPGGICEDFESGFTLGQPVGTHAEWFDNGSGPEVTSGNGLLDSIGLAPGSSIFTWTEYPFDWNDPAFESITYSMDFQTDTSGEFDDDRMGWMIVDDDASSANIFGAQLDHVDGGIVTYWRDDIDDTSTDARIQTEIVPLDPLSANTWFRFEATVIKLTDTSARIDVSLVELDASGNPTGTPYTGTVDDTSAWADGVPDERYFTAATMWPAYKNHTGLSGAADNVCFDVSSGRFAFMVSTDWHTSDSWPNAGISAKVAQIANWVNSPTADMPAPEFMVITGDFPHLYQTESIMDTEINPDFLWYPVMGNHEVYDSGDNFEAVRDTKVPTLPYLDDNGPTGSVNSTYSWTFENAHFIAINGYWDGNTSAGSDTAADGDVVPALNTWIGNDLATNGQTHNFVFIHEPAYPAYRHVGDSLDAHPANRDAFVATLNTYNAESLFAGHTHYYEHDVAPEFPLGNLHQVTNGSLRSGNDTTVTYVLVEGNTTTYKVYSWTGSAFTLIDQWSIGGLPPDTPPAAPTSLAAAAVSYSQINLTWTDNADDEANFEIERSTTGSGGTFTPLTSVPADTTTHNDYGLIQLSEYCYRVRATNVAGESTYSNVSCDTTPEQPALVGVCETFDAYTPGSTIGSYTGWFDGGTGPVVTSGIGIASTVGLSDAPNIFTWTAQPLDWTAPEFVSINLQGDFQTDGSGHFDDDRIGWMITDTSNGSDNIFGVQLDPGGSGYNIEAYWDGDTFGDNGGRTSIADLPTLPASSWYRLRAEITKLSATSAMITATLTELDASGNPGAVVASGSIADTALLPDTATNEIPNPAYFTGPIWPAYKNHNAIDGAFDNPCYEVLTGEPPEQYTLVASDDGNGSVTLNPAGGTYYDGTTVTLALVPNTGYTFDTWSGADAGDLSNNGDGTWDIVMDANKAVNANFVEIVVTYTEDFETYADGENPDDWIDTEASNSLVEDDTLFQVYNLSGNKVFGTSSTQTNIHSHYVGGDSANWTGYRYRGRMMMTADTGGMGVTFLSDYPNSDSYYRLRSYSGNSTFHLSPHGTSISGGTTDTGVTPTPDTWYWFVVEVENSGTQTEIRAKVWAAGTSEPASWQVDAYDANSVSRRINGTIGIWSMSTGNKYWDDLIVEPLSVPAEVVLNAGWNLITLPIEPLTAFDARSLLTTINAQGGNCSEVDRWLNGGWDPHLLAFPPTLNNFPIELGSGFFLRCAQASTFTYQGFEFSEATSLIFSSGWNLIGVPYPSGYTARSLLDGINAQGGDCSEIDRWLSGGWDPHLLVFPPTLNDFPIVSSQGYFMRCTQSSSFTP